VNGPLQQKPRLTFVGDSGHPLTIKTRATAEAGCQKGHSEKRLQAEFRRNGFIYRQVVRQGNAAIYAQNSGVTGNVCYEVIRIRRRDGFHIGGRFVEPAEVYPNSEAWGTDGFTLTGKDAALAKLRILIGF